MSSLSSPSRSPGFFSRNGWWLSFVPFLLWFVVWLFPALLDWDPRFAWLRGAGAWLAFLALLVPYYHIATIYLLRQQKPSRRSWFGSWFANQTLGLWLHMAGAFLSFVLVMIHSRAHASGILTLMILLLLWGVMLSGVIGYWGRKVIYRLLCVTLDAEFGRADRAVKEGPRLRRRAERILNEYWMLTEYDIGNWQSFCRDLLDKRWMKMSLWEQLEQRRGQPGYKSKEIGRLTVRRAVQARPVPARMLPLIGLLNEALDESKLWPIRIFESAISRNGLPNRERERCQRLHGAATLVFDREATIDEIHSALKKMGKEGWTQPASESLKQLCIQAAHRVENSRPCAGEQPNGGQLSDAEIEARRNLLTSLSERLQTMVADPEDWFAEDLETLEALHTQEIQRRNRLSIEMWSEEVGESRPPDSAVKGFFDGDVRPVLEAPDPSWGWIFTSGAREPILESRVEALRMLVGPGQARIVDALMNWVERRRQLDVEFWLDRLANCWVKVHGWLAWLLLALVLDHVVGSCLRGGWWPR